MPIQPAAILAHDFGLTQQHFAPRDAILYALGIGLGSNPCDPADLAFMDETDLKVLPSFAVTLATPGMWIRKPEFGVDFDRLVHAEQMAWFPESLPPDAEIVGDAKVLSLTDRGEGKGAVLVLERNVRAANGSAHYCRLQQTLLLRGDGGFGGPAAQRSAATIPDREPDRRATFATSPRAALIYRLSGDWNPLHLKPQVARRAGFERPILQGLASYGIASVAVSRSAARDPHDVIQLGCRFSGVVVPGDTLNFDIWDIAPDTAAFRAHVGDRKVLDQGIIAWSERQNARS